jgi:hypothetical protein
MSRVRPSDRHLPRRQYAAIRHGHAVGGARVSNVELVIDWQDEDRAESGNRYRVVGRCRIEATKKSLLRIIFPPATIVSRLNEP